MKKFNLDKYFWLGTYFLVLQIFVFIRNFFLGENFLFFHYCDNIALFLAIAFFLRNIPFIKSLVSVGLILQIVYFADFIANVFFGHYITGTTAYLSSYSLFAVIITLFMHFGTVFVALLFIFKEKNKLISLFYAFIYLCFLFFTTLFFTLKVNDINCIFNACGVKFLYFSGFTYLWIVLFFIFLVIPAHFFQDFLYFLAKKHKKNNETLIKPYLSKKKIQKEVKSS